MNYLQQWISKAEVDLFQSSISFFNQIANHDFLTLHLATGKRSVISLLHIYPILFIPSLLPVARRKGSNVIRLAWATS